VELVQFVLCVNMHTTLLSLEVPAGFLSGGAIGGIYPPSPLLLLSLEILKEKNFITAIFYIIVYCCCFLASYVHSDLILGLKVSKEGLKK